MPSWNGIEYRERHVEPRSPRFSFHPAGESRLDMPCWIDWSLLTSPDQIAPPLAQAGLVGYGTFVWDGRMNKPNYRFLSYSPGFVATLAGLLAPGFDAGGRLPLSYPGAPAGYYLCESVQATGDVPGVPGALPTGAANYDEGQCVLGFRRFPNGYTVLPDEAVVTPPGSANPAPGEPLAGDPTTAELPLSAPGDGTALPMIGQPNDYYLCRNVEVEESFASRAQSIPPSGPGGGGLVWADSVLPIPFAAAGTSPAASVANYIPLSHSEYTVRWYPVPWASSGQILARMQSLIIKTNRNPFPPPAPPGTPASFMPTRPRGTLIFHQPTRKIIDMGDANRAAVITLKITYHANGANYFYRWNRPRAEGGPGYARVARPDGSPLFAEADYARAFLP